MSDPLDDLTHEILNAEPDEYPDWELDRVPVETAEGQLAITSLTTSGRWIQGDNQVPLSDAL